MWRWSGNSSDSDHGSTSVLDRDCDVEGRLRFTGTFIINGKFRGEVVSPGTLLVGESAEIEGDIRVATAIVSGQVVGNIAARERVELRAGARITGDLITPALVLEEGVAFDGNCRMRSDAVAAAQKTS